MSNVRSIGPKLVVGPRKRKELEILCDNEKIDFIFISESWTGSEDTNEQVQINGFRIVSRVDKNTTTEEVVVYLFKPKIQ